jgi:hypothetical protein
LIFRDYLGIVHGDLFELDCAVSVDFIKRVAVSVIAHSTYRATTTRRFVSISPMRTLWTVPLDLDDLETIARIVFPDLVSILVLADYLLHQSPSSKKSDGSPDLLSSIEQGAESVSSCAEEVVSA